MFAFLCKAHSCCEATRACRGSWTFSHPTYQCDASTGSPTARMGISCIHSICIGVGRMGISCIQRRWIGRSALRTESGSV